MRSTPIPEFDHLKFFKYIRIDGDCWTWTGGKNENGYGKFHIGRKQYYAHRISFSVFRCDIGTGLIIDHTCKNTSCVNPEHLRQVTQKTNMLENSESVSYYHSLKTHCPQGHEYNESNTHIKKKGIRECRACDRARHKKKYVKVRDR